MRIPVNTIVILLLTGCSYIPWFGDDEKIEIEPREPAELGAISQELALQRNWSASGRGDADEKYIRLRPYFFSDKVAFADTNANIAVYEVANGRRVWSRSLSGNLSGGVGGDAQNAGRRKY